MGVLMGSLEVPGGPWGSPWKSLGVPRRPWDVLGRLGTVPGGRCFCHGPLCHVYPGKDYVSAVSLGALGHIEEVEASAPLCGFGPTTDIVISI